MATMKVTIATTGAKKLFKKNPKKNNVKINRNKIIIRQKNVSMAQKAMMFVSDGWEREDDEDVLPVPKVTVTAPVGSKMKGSFTGKVSISGDLEFSEVDVSAEFLADVNITVRGTLNASVHKYGFITAALCGSLKSTARRSGEVTVTGEFEQITADARTRGSIKTTGFCVNDYNASAELGGVVEHHGKIGRRFRWNESSHGTVLIIQDRVWIN